MKRVLTAVLLLCVLLTAARAEEAQTEYVCPYFSVRLPEGMRVISGDLLESLTAAAMADCRVGEDSCLMMALDETQKRGLNVIILEQAPAEYPCGNVGEVLEKTEMTVGKWSVTLCKIALDGSEYMQAYLRAGEVNAFITFCGMDAADCAALLWTLT